MADSHSTYIPFWDDERKNDWKQELREILKTLRLCVHCKTFQKFELAKREALWFHISCPVCKETVKIPRKANRAKNSYDKEMWK